MASADVQLHTACRGIKKCLKRSEGLNFGGRGGSNFLIHFGPSGPKLDSLVATAAFAEVNFVEKVSGQARRTSVSRVASLFLQKRELFLHFGIRVRVKLLISCLEWRPSFLNLKFLNRPAGCNPGKL
jgi:hypothetical protein